MANLPADPHVVVFSSLFPSERQPQAGLFVRERMFRVGRTLPLAVVSPRPWFPFQAWVSRWRPGFRPGAHRQETQAGVQIWYPRFLSLPGMLKHLDGLFMALGAWPQLRRLRQQGRLDLIDAHFGYPDGYAATLLGRWLGVPVTITMRGTEQRHAKDATLLPRLRHALSQASRVFSVSQSLRATALALGIAEDHVRVVGNGVDLEKFNPVPQEQARRSLGVAVDAPVLVSVGGLVERKGFHRVIALLPALRERFPGLQYLVVGGPSPEGDMSTALHKQVVDLGLEDVVRFLGPVAPERLHLPLSAADVFVLATRNEGWANVFLEAMACGLPVVTTDVGGNAEVVCQPGLGRIVPFDDGPGLREAVADALVTPWDRPAIRRYAADNTWDSRVAVLIDEFRRLHRRPPVRL